MISWTETSQALPAEHEYVHFVVVGHSNALLGVYENHSFRSRWGTYRETQVGTWHKLGDGSRVPVAARHANAEQRHGPERSTRGDSTPATHTAEQG